MSTIRFDGLASGIDTSSIIKAIIDVERLPVTHMENKLATAEARVAGMRALNQQIAALATQAGNLKEPASFRPSTGTSSSADVSVQVKDGADATQLRFTVESTATRHAGVSAPRTGWEPDTPVEITTADGTTRSYTGDSLTELVRAINADDELDVTATLIRAGTDAEGQAQYRLQLTADTTGAGAAFTATAGGADLFNPATGGAVTSTGTDAAVVLFAGTAAEQRITSATDTFEELATGVSVTVGADAVGSEVTVTAGQDPAAAATRATDLVQRVNALLDSIGRATGVTTTSGSTGSSATAGLFTGDQTIRSVNDRIFQAATRPEDGTSQSWLGIEPDRSGRLSVDAEKLKAALTEDPAKAATALAALAERVTTVATDISDRFGGVLTQAIESRVQDNRRTQDGIAAAERRLELRESTLRTQFTAMELALQKANDLQGWLSGQIAAMQPRSRND